MIQMYATWLSPLLSLAIALSIFMFSEKLGFLLASVLMIACAQSIVFPKLWFRYMRRCTAAKRKEDVARHVASLSPGTVREKWELVASNLNQMLYNDRSWRTPHFFFDGKQCRSCFIDQVVRPVMQGKFNSESGEKNVFREAVESYENALENAFNEIQRDSLPDLSEEFSTLPKYKHYTKLSFRKEYFASASFFLVLFFGCYLFFLVDPLESSCLTMLFCTYCFIRIALAQYKTYGDIRCAKLDLRSRVFFLAAVARVAPSIEIDKWDRVAMHMNQYLHSAEIWQTYDENFFDGVECLNFFKVEFQPLAADTLNLAYPELQNIVIKVVDVCGLE